MLAAGNKQHVRAMVEVHCWLHMAAEGKGCRPLWRTRGAQWDLYMFAGTLQNSRIRTCNQAVAQRASCRVISACFVASCMVPKVFTENNRIMASANRCS